MPTPDDMTYMLEATAGMGPYAPTQKEKAMPEGNDDYCGIGEVNPDDFTPGNDEVERVAESVMDILYEEGFEMSPIDTEKLSVKITERLAALSANPAKDEEVTEAMLSAGLAALRVSGMVETPLESDALVCGDIYLAMRGAR